MTKYLSIDLGAESGRAVVGHLEDGQLRLEVIHRFPNGPVRILDTLHWDVLSIWTEIKTGLAQATAASGDSLVSMGLDTWGVDYGLLAADGSLLANPYHYRDSRTDGIMEPAFEIVPRQEVYERTGIQFMAINSLFQLFASVRAGSSTLGCADTFLNMPDLFNYWLSGRQASEFTIATTSQCYDPRTGDWAWGMLDALGIPTRIFGEIVQPGTVLDSLLPSIAEDTGSPTIPVVASAGHDTASAVAAVPATGSDHIYISSGTWSLMGVELDAPLINDQGLAYNLTNEGGVNNTFRLLRNIMGLWLIQECRREWQRQGHGYSYDDLTRMAAQAPAFGPLVALGDERWLAPGDMPTRIQTYCRETGQTVPETRGQIVRCALESLALEYRLIAQRLDKLVSRHFSIIHIFGGGSQNKLLNQFAADATGRTVIAGPIEATATGNCLVQALALGHVGSLDEIRAIVRRSFPVDAYQPRNTTAWDEAFARYTVLGDQSQ